MCEAAERLRIITAAENKENITTREDDSIIADVTVTVNGTWQKRGHSFKIGVVLIISVRSGEILDYVVKSLICQECIANKNLDKESDKYLAWKLKHSTVYDINHTGPSAAMEADADTEMFLKSIDIRQLRYTVFVGDGDSSCYSRVKEALNAIYTVEKEKCAGHI